MKTARVMAPSSSSSANSSSSNAWSSSMSATPAPLGGGASGIMTISRSTTENSNSNISDAAMDAYAQRILEHHAALGSAGAPQLAVMLDESLGPYVTSILRNMVHDSDATTTTTTETMGSFKDVTLLPDYEGVIELLQEHCGFTTAEQARAALQEIANVVATGGRVLPAYISNEVPNNSNTAASAFPSLQALQTALPPQPQQQQQPTVLTTIVDEEEFPTLSQANAAAKTTSKRNSNAAAAAASNSVMSPNRADTLIPLHLLDEDGADTTTATAVAQNLKAEEAATPQDAPRTTATMADSTTDTASASVNGGSKPPRPQKETEKDVPTDFPPLGASKNSSSKKQSTPTRSSKKSASSHKDPDLAASLFRPARSRQSSIDETNAATTTATAGSSLGQGGGGVPTASSATATTATDGAGAYYPPPRPDPYIDPQHYESVVSMLIAMNGGVEMLSPEAAYTAAIMAPGADLGTAQYLIEAAATAPPICRHLLQAGCYRSDCTYSHDLPGHTCIFWLRGRCGKGETCRFLHGFHPQTLQKLQQQQQQAAGAGGVVCQDAYYHAQPPHLPPVQHHPNTAAAGAVSNGYMGPSPASAPDVVSSQAAASGSWGMPPTPQAPASSSFANIASQGYSTSSSFAEQPATSSWNNNNHNNHADTTTVLPSNRTNNIPTTRIPQNLWNAHENRDASVFHIPDPLERYRQVASTTAFHRSASSSTGLIDLHFQSTKTFRTVLDTILPTELEQAAARSRTTDGSGGSVWIVTGTGHHVGTQTHQKGGGALESAVLEYLVEQGYNDDGYRVYRGRDAGGHGGAILVRAPPAR